MKLSVTLDESKNHLLMSDKVLPMGGHRAGAWVSLEGQVGAGFPLFHDTGGKEDTGREVLTKWRLSEETLVSEDPAFLVQWVRSHLLGTWGWDGEGVGGDRQRVPDKARLSHSGQTSQRLVNERHPSLL